MFALVTAAMLLLGALEVRRLPAADAHQGVVSDGPHVYAVSNHAIAKLDARSGRQLARWDGDPARFQHMNSCIARAGILLCAGSNYPETPMQSRLERFDARTMRHLSTQPLGHDYGSLTWVDRHDGAWWACYANYDGRGGEPGRDHRATLLVRYDSAWHEQAHWRFPAAVLDRFAPMSASGGAWGRDGLLYVSGHNRPELYVLDVPKAGTELRLVATITTPTDGQAIGWDRHDPRLLWSIARDRGEVVASRIPPVPRPSRP